MEDGIAARLGAVRARIDAAARRAGRAPADVKLVAVSKGQPVSALRDALDAGQRDFGENYAQELEQKCSDLGAAAAGATFHFIGRLQRNKVAKVIACAKVVHVVDRAELAAELDRRAAARSERVRVFVEVNVGAEGTKAGVSPDALGPLLDQVRACASLDLVGLMAIPPDVEDAERARPYFRRLRELRDEHGGPRGLPELSMGMSHDFEIAIEEGATFVRVGTAIFGARAPRAVEVGA